MARDPEFGGRVFNIMHFMRKFLLLGTVFLPLFSIIYNPQSILKGAIDVRMISGFACLLLYILSYKSQFVKKNLQLILHMLVFLAIPYMNYVLYKSNFNHIWMIYHLIMFTAMSSLFFRKDKYLVFVLHFASCFAIAYYMAETVIIEKELMGFLMLGFVAINYVLHNSFLLNLNELRNSSQHLAKQNDALKKYAFMNAHKIRGPLARVIGLVNLMRYDGNKSKEMKLLGDASNELDQVIRSAQEKLDLSVEKHQVDQHKDNPSKKKLSGKIIPFKQSKFA